MNPQPNAAQWQEARAVLADLGLTAQEQPHGLMSAQRTSLPVLASASGGKGFLLKYYLPLPEATVLPPGAGPADFGRRESGFYRFLDSVDPQRRDFPAPRTIAYGPGDPPRWILLEWLPLAAGPAEEVIGQEHAIELLRKLAAMP
ncbi:MAG: hypothetical protein FJ306_12940, partial [Planctomycetes bacterium]|nr:hypothetical protein [Planctomycetota bacterium]